MSNLLTKSYLKKFSLSKILKKNYGKDFVNYKQTKKRRTKL